MVLVTGLLEKQRFGWSSEKEQQSRAGRELGCLLCFARIKPGLLGSATAEEEMQSSAPAEHVKAKTGEELLTGVSSNSVMG